MQKGTMMPKLIRRIATSSVSAALAGVVLLATGSSATAATAHPHGHTAIRAVEGTGTGALTTHHSRRSDPWIADQLATVNPWIADHLALFAPSHDNRHTWHCANR